MNAPWTARERALLAALVALVGHIKREELEAYKELCRDDGKPRRYPITVTDHAIIAGCNALADPPPPDTRDAALRLAEAELLRLWKLVPAGRAGVGGVRTIELEDDEVARLRQIVDAIRAAKGGA